MSLRELGDMQLPSLENAVIRPKLENLLPLTCLALWLGWRIWRFTILPLIYPKEPKELPYWIPSKRSENAESLTQT